MKPELQAKFLQHLNKKKKDGGFTLIELLVVIIIIGILAAIALPSLLAQSNKARQSEARNNTGTLNRAQQAFFLEKSGFTTSFSDLGIGIATQTANYKYEAFSSVTGGVAAIVANVSTPVTNGILKAYAGIVYITLIKVQGSSDQSATQAKACEGKDPSVAALTAAPSTFTDCPGLTGGYIDLGG